MPLKSICPAILHILECNPSPSNGVTIYTIQYQPFCQYWPPVNIFDQQTFSESQTYFEIE